MQIRSNELTCAFDVDETLITKTWPASAAARSFTTTNEDLSLNYYGQEVCARPIAKHIEFLKFKLHRGYEITVWSANGVKWAKEVVEKLGLTEYVHYVATKPLFYVDDKPADLWTKRVFIAD